MHHIILPNTKYRFLCYTILIISLLLAFKGKSQVNTNWPANALNSLEGVVVVPEEWNGQPTDVAEITNRMKAQDDYLGDVWSKYFPTRALTTNSTVETIPMSVYNSIVAPDIIHTLTNFFNYMVNNGGINGVPRDPKKDYTFIANERFGNNFGRNYFRTESDENQYTSTTVYSEDAIGMGTATNPWGHWKAHELGHGTSANPWSKATYTSPRHGLFVSDSTENLAKNNIKHTISAEDIRHLRDDDHPFGKNIPIQVNYGTEANPNWIQYNPEDIKTIMAAGTASGSYVPVYTSSVDNIIADEEDWVYSTYSPTPDDSYQCRVKKSDLKNGTNNTVNKTSDYIINTNPALVHSTPLNASELPVAPQISVTNNQLTITNINDYPETVRGHKVRYFVYVYDKNNVQNNQYLNTNRPGGYPINETIDVSQFVGPNGVPDVTRLAFTVFGDKVNSNSDETEMEAPDQAPVLPDNIQVVLNGDDATLTHTPATDPDGDPIVRYEHRVNNGNWESHGTDLSFEVNNLNIGPQSVKIRAVTIVDGQPVYSNEISTLVNVPDYPPETTGLPAVTTDGHNAEIVCPIGTDANHDTQNFTYEIRLDGGNPISLGSNRTYNAQSLATGEHNVDYRVKTGNQYSEWSGLQNFQIENTPPPAPSNLHEIDVQANSAKFGWNESVDPDAGDQTQGYKILDANGTVIMTTTNLFVEIFGLPANTDVTFGVKSFDAFGGESPAATITIHTQESTNLPPNPPENIAVSDVTYNSAHISWDQATDPDSPLARYEVIVNGELQGTFLPTDNLAMDVALETNSNNLIQVAVYDVEGASAAASTQVETPKAPDTTPPNEMNENTFLKDVHAHRVVLTLAQAITDNASDPNQEVSGIDRVEIYVDGVYHSEIVNPQVGDTQTVADLNPEQTYTFKYIAIDNEGNQSEFAEEITTDFDGIDENVAGIEVQAYPNPTTDKVKVTLPENAQVKNVMVYNLAGQLVKALETPYFSHGKQVLEIDMTELASGTYLFKIKTANTVFKGKLVKR